MRCRILVQSSEHVGSVLFPVPFETPAFLSQVQVPCSPCPPSPLLTLTKAFLTHTPATCLNSEIHQIICVGELNIEVVHIFSV